MATAVASQTAIVVSLPPEVLGPASKYEEKRLAIKHEYDQIIAEAKKLLAVDSPEALEKANNLGRILQAGTKDVESFFKPIKQQIDAMKAPVLQSENEMKAVLDGEKRRLGALITTYNQEQERLRQEEERRQREAAAETAREQQLAAAIELDLSGDKEGAEAILNEEVSPAPVIIQQVAAPKMAGQVGKTVYKCRVENVKELLQAVAEGKAPMQCFTLDQGYLDRKAGLDKDGFSLPGCKLDKQASTHFRA